MSRQVILITGANCGLDQARGRAFLGEHPQNFVWLGVRARREKADGLAGDEARNTTGSVLKGDGGIL